MASRKKKWYAWTRFPKKPTVDSKSGAIITRPFVKPGDEVTPEILGIKEGEFDQLVIAGCIRSTPYPKVNSDIAPKRAMLAEARKQLELAQVGGGIDDPYDDGEDDAADDGLAT